MAYIGNTPALQYITHAKQTFTPDSSTVAFTLSNAVANENELEVFVNNVRQEPGSGKAYTASGTTLTMSEAPNTGDGFYCIYQGKATQTVTPGASTVTNAMLAGSIANAKLANSSITLNSSAVSLGGSHSIVNTPAWSVGISANQSIANGTYTKVAFDREEVDTDNAFDNSTNYRFTVPSGKAGKYFVAASLRNTSSSDFDSYYLNLKKNGSDYIFASIRNEFRETVTTSCLIDLSVGDYLEVFAYNGEGSSIDLSGSSDKPSGTHFSGFRILS